LRALNWYDFVVIVALIYGAWSGLRAGLTGEIIRVIGLVLMIVLAFQLYQPLGNWLQAHSPLTGEAVYLVAFVSIAVVVHLLALAARLAAHRHVQKLKLAAMIENVGGSLAGVIRMIVIMAWLTAFLCLAGSDFWRHEVGEQSRFGSFVATFVPTVKAMFEKNFPERKTGLMPDLKRRPEPDYEGGGPTNTKSPPTTAR
jgi:uncharacterized membrane protein required for colicin V production